MNIAIAHQKGGVGKSSIAWHLAHILSPKLVIDLDSQQTLHSLNSIRAAAGHTPLPLQSPQSKPELVTLLQRYEGDLTITDLGGFDSDLNRMAIAGADMVIAPVSDSPVEILGLQKFRKTLLDISKSVGAPLSAHVLLNRVHHSRKNFTGFIEMVEALGFQLLTIPIIEHKDGVGESVCKGLSVVEYINDDSKRIVRDFQNVAEEILNYLNELD